MNKYPNISIVAANVQGLNERRKRFKTFSRYSNSSADIFLLSETGKPTLEKVNEWTLECKNLGLNSLFSTANNTAILWKAESQIVKIDNSIPTNSLTNSLTNNTRSTDASFLIGTSSITIMAVYVPVQPPERKTYLSNLSNVLKEGTFSSFIIGGDWNCVEDPRIDSSKEVGDNTGVVELKKLISTSSLSDAYRITNPLTKLFTNTPTMAGGAQRRLDRFYISQDLTSLIRRNATWSAERSTHSPILVSLFLPGSIEIGPGKFKFGTHHLEQDGIPEYLTEKLTKFHSKSLELHPNNPLLAWNATKILLTDFLKTLSIKFSHFSHSCNLDTEDVRHKGAAKRARLSPGLCGFSSVQIRLKQIRAKDLIPSIQTPTGEVTSTDEMLGAAKDFFSSLYDEKPCDPASLSTLIDAIERTLDPASSASLEKDYTLEELEIALKACARGSTPGPDGIPFEYYTATWEVSGPILLAALNFIPTQEVESLPLKEAHIHLPHKKGNHSSLSNKRPISIINSDERLFSQTHNKRLAPLLHQIVRPTQTGFIPDRWIGDNIAQMQTAMDLEESHPGLIASMDFEKAYDRVSHIYMAAIFRAMGFGPKALSWISSTYLQQTARIFLNGWLSDAFFILSGVRQGDPLAPSLFAIIIEGFAALIRKLVAGIPSTSLPLLKESLFADDATCFLRNYSDVNQLDKAIEIYNLASSSKLNVDKSFLFPLGKFRHLPLLQQNFKSWRISTEPFRHLGVKVGIDYNNEVEWKEIEAGVVRRIRTIPMYDLPIATKCSIINIYCYSKILYYDKFSPAPLETIKRIIAVVLAAIWGGRTAKVSEHRLYTTLDRGGFGLFNLELQLKGPRAEWIYSLLNRSSYAIRYLLQIRCTQLKETLLRTYIYQDPMNRLTSPKTTWMWYSLFCHPSSFGDGVWSETIERFTSLLPTRWIKYLEAWNSFSSLSPTLIKTRAQWHEKVLNPTRKIECNSSIPAIFFTAPGSEVGEGIQSSSFIATTSHLNLQHYEVIQPEASSRHLNIELQHWKRYWKALRIFRRSLPDEVNSAHLLSLGSLHPGKQVASLRTLGLSPHNGSKNCILCLTEQEETLSHLLTECSVSQEIWNSASTPSIPHPSLREFTCPTISKGSHSIPALRIIFIHIIWKLSRSRRFSRSILPLQQLDAVEVAKIVKNLRTTWKYSTFKKGF